MATLEEIRAKKGQSNAYSYPGVAKKNFAGPNETYPINTMKRARAALSLAHNAQDPESIRQAVYEKYPSLRKAKR